MLGYLYIDMYMYMFMCVCALFLLHLSGFVAQHLHDRSASINFSNGKALAVWKCSDHIGNQCCDQAGVDLLLLVLAHGLPIFHDSIPIATCRLRCNHHTRACRQSPFQSLARRQHHAEDSPLHKCSPAAALLIKRGQVLETWNSETMAGLVELESIIYHSWCQSSMLQQVRQCRQKRSLLCTQCQSHGPKTTPHMLP